MLRCQFLCHVLKALFFIKIALNLSYFRKKTQNFRALGAPLPDPRTQPPYPPQACAVDLAMLVAGADMLWIREMTQYWASEQELQISTKQTEIILFTHKRNPDLGSLSKKGSKLELSEKVRELGATLNSKLTWKPHILPAKQLQQLVRTPLISL